MAKHSGRLELTWADKDKALLSSGDGIYDYTFVERTDPRVLEVRLLHEVERVEAAVPSERPDDLPQPTTDNLLITGDSMHALDALRKTPEWSAKYVGKVKLVYIDPPFNTGQTFDHYEDSIDHSIWLTMLRDRLRQIRPLLTEDSSVWVHLDHVESHRCRAVLDEELGPENFVAEVAWEKTVTPRNDTTGLSVSQDVLLVYRRTDKWRPNRLARLASSNSRYGSPDGDPVLWRDGSTSAPDAVNNQGWVYAIQHPITGVLMYPPGLSCWRLNQERLFNALSEYAKYELRDIDDAAKRAEICGIPEDKVRPGVKAIMLAVPVEEAAITARERVERGVWPEIYLTRGGFQIKRHLEDKGRVPQTLWSSLEVGANLEGKAEIKALFPGVNPFATPKPERLLQRVIHIGSNPGDIVLDCFAGSGTTAAVAHKMGRRWVTSELLPVTVDTYTKPRLKKVVCGEDPGGITVRKERVGVTDEIPGGLTPEEAQTFSQMLGKVSKAVDGLDAATVKTLREVTKTKEEVTTMWHGGGGFTHVAVGPSMYDVDQEDGDIYLSEAAVNGEWSKSVAAQLKFTLTPEHPVFSGVRGRQRLAVVDGVADEVVIRTVVQSLGAGERAVVVAKVVLPEAEALLSDLSPGSRLKKAPRDLFPKRTVK